MILLFALLLVGSVFTYVAFSAQSKEIEELRSENIRLRRQISDLEIEIKSYKKNE